MEGLEKWKRVYYNKLLLLGSIFHALRTHSISYFHERGGLNRDGACLQFELEKGGLVEKQRNRVFTVSIFQIASQQILL